jgi:hypothetical protein
MQNLLLRLADAKHHAGFGDPDTFLLRVLQDFETCSEVRAAVTNVGRERLHCFDIVRIHIEPGLGHDGDVFERTPEVASESLYQYVRRPAHKISESSKRKWNPISLLLNLSNSLSEVVRTSVRKVCAPD